MSPRGTASLDWARGTCRARPCDADCAAMADTTPDRTVADAIERVLASRADRRRRAGSGRRGGARHHRSGTRAPAPAARAGAAAGGTPACGSGAAARRAAAATRGGRGHRHAGCRAVAGRRRRRHRSTGRAAHHGRACVNTGRTGFAYSQARLQARLGQSSDHAEIDRAHAARDLAGFLAAMRATSLRRYTARLAATLAPHDLERHLRGEWSALVDEVAQWQPAAWQPAIRWLRWLPYLPALQKLARDGRPRGVEQGRPGAGPRGGGRARAAPGGARRLAAAAAATRADGPGRHGRGMAGALASVAPRGDRRPVAPWTPSALPR